MKPESDTNPPKETPDLRPHVYDGIQEYDQKLPNWWLFTFYGAIAIFVVYWLGYYQFPVIPTDEQYLKEAMAKIDTARLQELASINDDRLWEMSRDPKVVEAGKATFMSTCVACHGADLRGKKGNPLLPGLDLTDQEWKYGHNPTDVLKIVRKGSPDLTKGMPTWEPVLGVKRVVEVVAFVFSHHQKGEPFSSAPDAPPAGITTAAITPAN